jgi:hypothetical protein
MEFHDFSSFGMAVIHSSWTKFGYSLIILKCEGGNVKMEKIFMFFCIVKTIRITSL